MCRCVMYIIGQVSSDNGWKDRGLKYEKMSVVDSRRAEAQGIAVVSIVQVKAPRRLQSQNSQSSYLPTVTTLPFLLTAPILLLLFTIEESTLNFLLTTSVSAVIKVATLPRLYRLLRTLLDCLSGGGMVIAPSSGTGAEVGDKSDSEGSECGNCDNLGTRGGPTGIAFPNS
jgi:hypothetical protein